MKNFLSTYKIPIIVILSVVAILVYLHYHNKKKMAMEKKPAPKPKPFKKTNQDGGKTDVSDNATVSPSDIAATEGYNTGDQKTPADKQLIAPLLDIGNLNAQYNPNWLKEVPLNQQGAGAGVLLPEYGGGFKFDGEENADIPEGARLKINRINSQLQD